MGGTKGLNMADIKESLREDFDADAAWDVLASADVAQTAGNERLLKATLAETPPEVALDALIAGYTGTQYEESVRAFAANANQNPDLMTEIGAVLANNDEDGFLVVAGMAQSGAPADAAQTVADLEQFSKANTENRDGMSIKEGVMWLVDNGLYNTQRPWYTVENILNIGFLGVSVVAGAVSGGGGTAALIGGRVALGTGAKVVLREAVKEGVEDFVIKPAAKGAFRAGVVEPLATAPLMGAIGALGSEETPEAPEAPEDQQNETVETQEPEIATDQPVIDPVRKGFMDAFNTAASVIEMFVPKQTVGFLAGIAAAFMIATSGDGDDSTNKMQELSGLPELFMEAAMGIKPEETTPPAYTTEPRPSAGAPALVG